MGVRAVVGSQVRCSSLLLPLLVATAGCSFDSAPTAVASGVSVQRPAGDDRGTPPAGDAVDSGSVAGGGGSTLPASTTPPAAGPEQRDASVPDPSDAAEPAATPDAAVVPPADADVPETAADTGTAPVDPKPKPKGDLFDRCVTDDGCGLGLLCYGSGPGHCTEPCEESSDCTDVEGIDHTCSSDEGACRVDCGEDGTEGECPKGLTCVNRSGQYRCMLPREEGTGDRQLFETCDRAHGDDDCVDGLVCYRSSDSRIDGPGYCTVDCADDGSACEDMHASPAVLDCAESACRFDCSDAPCPLGMACEVLDDRAVCHYPTL